MPHQMVALFGCYQDNCGTFKLVNKLSLNNDNNLWGERCILEEKQLSPQSQIILLAVGISGESWRPELRQRSRRQHVDLTRLIMCISSLIMCSPYSLSRRCPLCTRYGPLQKITGSQSSELRCSVPTGTCTVENLHLRLIDHDWTGSRKIVRARVRARGCWDVVPH